MIPKEIKQKISEMSTAYGNVPGFADEYRYDAKRAIDYGTGAIAGYSLASSEISTLEQTIIDQDAQILELRKELERVKVLLKKFVQNEALGECYASNLSQQDGEIQLEAAWQEFKTKHNL